MSNQRPPPTAMRKCACGRVGLFHEERCRTCRREAAAQAANTLGKRRRYWAQKNRLRGYPTCSPLAGGAGCGGMQDLLKGSAGETFWEACSC